MRILVIEDEKGIASFIKKGLEAEYFAVDDTPDGEKGLWQARTNEYDAVVLDIMLPGKNGIEICGELRKEKQEVPIIMLTVKNDLETKVQAFNSGADDYLTKPFAIEELSARLRALLRREKNIKGDTFKVGDLELDTITHTVTRGGKSIDLSKKQFVLLEYFMRNPKVVLTRSMILEHVWDMNADPFTNTVDVHIKFLREKINSGHKEKFIQTVRSCGYKFEYNRVKY